jgi:hypothetical protein
VPASHKRPGRGLLPEKRGQPGSRVHGPKRSLLSLKSPTVQQMMYRLGWTDTHLFCEGAMDKQFILEVTDKGQKAFITERSGELYLTRQREEAAVYRSELEAKCAFVYVGENYQPKIVPCR